MSLKNQKKQACTLPLFTLTEMGYFNSKMSAVYTALQIQMLDLQVSWFKHLIASILGTCTIAPSGTMQIVPLAEEHVLDCS